MGGFVNPQLLLLLPLLAGIPILIHLLSRHRYQRVPWAAMDFLLAAYQKTRRRLRMENLLLLLLRILVIVLLALALSRPTLAPPALMKPLSQNPRNVLLVLDNSFSMNCRRGLQTPFEAGRVLGQRILRSLGEGKGNTVSLMLTSPVPRIVLERSYLIGKGIEELERVQSPAQQRTNVQKVFGEIQRFLREIDLGKEVYWITDLQKNGWLAGEEEERNLKRAIEAVMEEDCSFTLLDVGFDSVKNLTVTRLVPGEGIIGTGRLMAFRAQVKNSGNMPGSTSVSLYLDGEQKEPVEKKAVRELSPNEEEEIIFFQSFKEGGSHAVRVELEEDDLPDDNQRFLALDVKDRVSILCVEGEPWAPEEKGFQWFLQYALDPWRDETSEVPFFRIDPVDRYALLEKRLEDFDLVFFSNVPEIMEEKASQLISFIEEGGSLSVFLGSEVDPGVYNSLFFRDGRGFLPSSLTLRKGDSTRKEAWSLQIIEPDHPALQVFSDRELSGLFTSDIKVYEYFGTGVLSEGSKVLASVDDESAAPFLLERRIGRGKVLLCTTSGTRQWTDFPTRPGFLIFINEVVKYLTFQDPLQGSWRKNFQVGETLVRVQEIPGKASVLFPDGTMKVAGEPKKEGKGYRIEIPEIPMAGFFRMVMESPRLKREDLFAANVDPREGELDRASPEEIRGRFPKFHFLTRLEKEEEGEERRPPQGEIWKLLVGLLMGMLFLEAFLSWKFGWRER